MIRIVRPQEPQALTQERHWRLARALLAWHEKSKETEPAWDGHEKKQFNEGYKQGREQLSTAQHNKCAFCERKLGKTDPVEHFRPRRGIEKTHGHTGYWWLTWTWENLLRICWDCNSYKGSQFDLESGSRRLVPPELPPGDEKTMFVDPCHEDPRRHIRFEYVTRPEQERWEPVGKTDEGEYTIQELQLQTTRLDQYHSHVRPLEKEGGAIWDIRQAFEQDNPDALNRWTRVTSNLLYKEQEYRSFMYDYLKQMRKELEAKHNVQLSALPTLSPSPTAPSPPLSLFDWQAPLESLDYQMRLKVLSIGDRTSDEEFEHKLIIELVGVRDWTVDELASLLSRSPDKIKKYARHLQQQGRLQYEPARGILSNLPDESGA